MIYNKYWFSTYLFKNWRPEGQIGITAKIIDIRIEEQSYKCIIGFGQFCHFLRPTWAHIGDQPIPSTEMLANSVVFT